MLLKEYDVVKGEYVIEIYSSGRSAEANFNTFSGYVLLENVSTFF